ncbi:MAG: hypothetical protein PHI31_08925 [Desulfuromonadaceae bacterium]|nr:hypothetical protein [Desulfuromonadaceae bacterium]
MEEVAGIDLSGMFGMVEGILKGLTDEQLSQAIELIKAEQESRLKSA